MTYTKTVAVKTDWLQEVDGLTVAQAIVYLSTLNPDHVLSSELEGGDTHGVSIASNLYYEVPMSNAEILAYLEAHYQRQIADREKGKQYYIDRGQLDRVPQSEKLIADLQAKLQDARNKYGD